MWYVWLLLTQQGQDIQEFKQKLHRCYKIDQSTSTQTGSPLQAEPLFVTSWWKTVQTIDNNDFAQGVNSDVGCEPSSYTLFFIQC